MAWVFWRGALIEVWNSIRRRLPSRVRMPSGPRLHPPEHVVLDLHVPGEVVLARLDHRARGRHGVAPALHFQPVEEGPVGLVIRGEELGTDEVAGLEIDEAVGACADRPEIGRSLTRPGALEGFEDVLGNDAAEGVGP